MNQVILTGNLASDVDLRYTQSEKAVANFRLATNDGWGENKKANFHTVIVWGKPAELANQYLKKGSKAGVSGRIEYRSYEHEGVKKWATEIVASQVEFLDSKDEPKQELNQEPKYDIPSTDFQEDSLPF